LNEEKGAHGITIPFAVGYLVACIQARECMTNGSEISPEALKKVAQQPFNEIVGYGNPLEVESCMMIPLHLEVFRRIS
jgi:hypothetical protein